ncbi:MAG: MgtC/SapB family protein [Burkholderiaceae bacterium]|nr:MgtC/SapB family protein [Burkholderiaceae bacterium]
MESLFEYWSIAAIKINLLIFANLLGAMLLGFIVGYERHYHGRAAGMRTYGLVCMASASLTVFSGYPEFWFAGHRTLLGTGDPTRVIQGIVTGIGFLGAGVIMRDGMTISGLTTAASLWASSAIGVLVGVGFYAAAILLTALSAACMMFVSHIEALLPAHPAVAVSITFVPNIKVEMEGVQAQMREAGFDIAAGSITVSMRDGSLNWHFVAQAKDRRIGKSVTTLADLLSKQAGIGSFDVAHARN